MLDIGVVDFGKVKNASPRPSDATNSLQLSTIEDKGLSSSLQTALLKADAAVMILMADSSDRSLSNASREEAFSVTAAFGKDNDTVLGSAKVTKYVAVSGIHDMM